jgi:outer membrane protein assembly factor BamA
MAQAFARTSGYPSEEFFGVGPESRRSDQTAYGLDSVSAGGLLSFQATPSLSFGGGVESLRLTIGPGHSDTLRSVEQVFAAAPELFGGHRFVRTVGHVTYDYRQPLNARKGGWYRLDISRYRDRLGGAESFTRADLDVRQYVSFLAERRVLAARVRLSTTDAADGSAVPFFLLPSLGGHDSLRGFRAQRFRGPHAVLFQGEYRWEIWSGLEAALFYDAGKVTSRRSDLNLRSLERDYGFGFRFNTDNGVIVRVDTAFGSRDGRHLHVVFGGIF